MKVLIAPNNFKESINAYEAAKAIERGLLAASKGHDVTCLPLSDGGEGFVKAMVNALKGKLRYCQVSDPLGCEIESYYGHLSDRTAVIEMALASGIELLNESEKNPLITTSYGTGELIKQAIDQGYKHIIIGLGGSATNDGGTGMLNALGVKFYDKSNHVIDTLDGSQLGNIQRIETEDFNKNIQGVTFTVACDVTNPLLGTKGATHVYGTQKGANTAMLEILEKGMQNFASVTQETLKVDHKNKPGAGAAGGLGFALVSYLKGELKSGFNIVSEETNLRQQIKKAEIIVTGEGKIDAQTAQGKLLSRIGKLCQHEKKPMIAIGGIVEPNLAVPGVIKYFEISSLARDKKDAMKNVGHYLEVIGKEIGMLNN